MMMFLVMMLSFFAMSMLFVLCLRERLFSICRSWSWSQKLLQLLLLQLQLLQILNNLSLKHKTKSIDIAKKESIITRNIIITILIPQVIPILQVILIEKKSIIITSTVIRKKKHQKKPKLKNNQRKRRPKKRKHQSKLKSQLNQWS
jgi:hypothetical protein